MPEIKNVKRVKVKLYQADEHANTILRK